MCSGLRCDSKGKFLPENAPPPAQDTLPNGFYPFDNRASFEPADLLFRREQMSAGNINDLLQIWASSLPDDQDPPFPGKQGMYETIDTIKEADVPWESFSVSFNGNVAEGDTTPWKHVTYEVWFRDPPLLPHAQLSNPDYALEMDFAPKEIRNEKDSRRYLGKQ